MNDSFKKDFKRSLDTGFIDHNIESEVLYRPKLLTNKRIPKEKILSTLLQELSNCDEFSISVAFVTTSGIAVLLNTLLELEQKGIKGKVLVSQYLNFTQPEALKRILNFKNIELKIATKSNSHSKGYIFKIANYYNIIIGSSNLTASALTVNKEWNLKVSGFHSSEIVNNVLSEFELDFNEGTIVTDKYISEYDIIYKKAKISNRIAKEAITTNNIVPNVMQSEALRNLEKLRFEQKSKALIISATGTGKTYLSAFDVKAFKPKKLLFVVHRLNIAKKALETFKGIFKDKTLGLYSGNKRELDSDFVFSTIQTISREDHLSKFKKDHFDYIIIDESHRSGANSYLRLIEYFKPLFLLGMTATPERTDGNDIFSLFDHNIAYEIRLSRAMEEGMLSQFHYFGITDLKVNNELLENTKDFNLLARNDRVEKIIEKSQLYGTYNGITRGLVFCSRNSEAKLLSEKFNEKGHKSIALTGENSETERSEAIRCLESEDLNEKIDYIFTVDIFNEGIDIPKINQIIMIRPTESAIIFVQQLGRGLRKVEGKDFLTVIDFIGNHKNNYLIPVALYGDTSFNKDTLRKLISEGSRIIPGSSTINFDEISKEKIFKSIDSANMQLLSDLKKDYSLLKYRLGRVPMMIDFLVNESRDPFLFIDYSKSYYNFVVKADKDFNSTLNQELVILLELFSREINNAKRIEESYILKELLSNDELELNKFQETIHTKYGYHPSSKTIKSCLRNLNFEFIRKEQNIIIKKNETLMFHKKFLVHLKQKDFKKFLLDSINYSINTFDKKYKNEYFKNGLILFNKYSRKDVCRLLNWDKDVSSTLYGYRTNENITPCFVTYHKSHEIEDSIKYNDFFVNPSVFAWESRSNRKIESNEIQNVINSERILLFVKKGDGEGTDFYFMGDCSIIPDSIEQAVMPDSKKPIVHFKFKLEQPVSENLYQYITSNNITEVIEQVKDIFTIPLYDFYAAAGNFSDLQSDKTYSQIIVPEKYSQNTDYFACKVIGESMNKRIPNGSICIFKKYSAGSRSGKILLIENYDRQDPDYNSAFTVKTYASQKAISEEGWEHLEILLKPNSFDLSYKDIIINEENANEMNVIGEFIEVLE
jgi:superfamily II DNA or RNA helicase/HKD family nuclease/SOS-response transcriptional repressor LexA